MVNLRPERASFSYAESEGSTSPGAASGASSFDGSPQSSKTSSRVHNGSDSDDDVDELSDDVIHGERMDMTCRRHC